MSASGRISPQAQPPNAVLTLSATSGTAPLTYHASTANSSSPNVNGTIASSTINFGDSTPTVSRPERESHVQLARHIYGHRYGNGQRGRNCFDDAESYGSPATPTAVLSVTPTSGAAPLSVSASLASSSSPDGTISSGTTSISATAPDGYGSDREPYLQLTRHFYGHRNSH